MIAMGGKTTRSRPGPVTVEIRRPKFAVPAMQGRAGRIVAATLKNEIQADIRAIREPVSEATVRRRELGTRAFLDWLGLAGTRRRKRKHLGQGTFGNDSGRLADGLRVEWQPVSQSIEVHTTRTPSDRMQTRDEVWRDRVSAMLAFREKLIALCPTLATPNVLWLRPRVQAAIARVTSASFAMDEWIRGASGVVGKPSGLDAWLGEALGGLR